MMVLSCRIHNTARRHIGRKFKRWRVLHRRLFITLQVTLQIFRKKTLFFQFSVYDFEFEPTQTPIQVPIRYDEISATIEPSPIERMPFSAPDFNQLKLARTMGAKNPQFLVEHPDLKSAGRSQGITSSMKAKVIIFVCSAEHKKGLKMK